MVLQRAKTVSEIKAHLLRPATTSHFEVEIGLPPGRIGSSLWRLLSTDQRKLHLLCSEAALPGSNLATMNIDNDFVGVTEKHVHRRVYDDVIELTFYVDASNYLPVKFFEMWMDEITGGDKSTDRMAKNYSYTMEYPDDYTADQGLIVRKFERDYDQGGAQLQYEFVRTFPKNISSMPVNYDSSDLMKVSVSMSYIRYVINELQSPAAVEANFISNILQQAGFNNNFGSLINNAPGMFGRMAGQAVTNATGSRAVGAIAGGLVQNLF